MYDLVIKNGRIIDGTGSPSFFADVAIKDGKIAKVSKNIAGGEEVIDAHDLTVTPGFIDSHSHSDKAILDLPEMKEKVEQGITTSVSGQCGGTVAPQKISDQNDRYIEGVGMLSDICKTFGSFAERVKNIPLGSSNICLVGHASVRKFVMDMSQEKPTEAELEEMKALIRDAMEHGALGMSIGLIYPPSCYADTDELIDLAKVVKEYDGVIAAHIRSESDQLIEAVEEFIEIIRKSGVRGVISHHKACGSPKNWGKVNQTLKMIDDANADGLDIYLDVYPYTATHTKASVTFVPDSGRDLMKRLESEEERKKMREWNNTKWWANDYSWVQVTKCKGYPEYEGLLVPEIAKIHGKDEYDTILDMIHKSKNACSCSYFTMCEEDVKNVMSHPRTMICTDSGVAGSRTTFHPRLKGSFPRTIGRYVREENVVPLQEMVRKMTSMPARVYGLRSKGLVWEGMDADLCIFDAEKIIDCSEFSDCNKRAHGLNYVIVGGRVVVEDAVFNGNKMGKMIFREA